VDSGKSFFYVLRFSERTTRSRRAYPLHRLHRYLPALVLLLCALVFYAFPSRARDKDLPAGVVTEFAAPINDVLPILKEVVEDQTIHGTYMFDKDPHLLGAVAVNSTPLFKPWKEDGKVFYKVRYDAIAPRHFHESADQGTIAIRYVITSVSAERTRLRVDAVFVENFHKVVHASDGTVESSESKVIEERLRAVQFAEQEAADARRRRDSLDLARQSILREREDESTLLATTQASTESLERRVNALRHELERRVKAPGATLKATPFRSAANLADLPAFTEVIVVIVTPRWYGIETPDGRRGWLPIDQLEMLP